MVVLNMMDVLRADGLDVDVELLSQELGCPVVPVVAKRRHGLQPLLEALQHPVQPASGRPWGGEAGCEGELQARFAWISQLCAGAVHQAQGMRTDVTGWVDRIVLNRLLGIPVFLGMMYLLFMVAINVGSAFIDFFDGVAGAIFVDGVTWAMNGIGAPGWVTTLLARGVGSGIQLVASFIPVIACLFFFLSFMEGSGYMARAAFVVDRGMRALGLPGKAFVPLIVGFGCNVPSVMAARTLDTAPDRLLTTLMAPFMSCGARLTVYALFVAAFFPNGGQNVVFGLYLLGIALAVATGFLLRRYLFTGETAPFIMELPRYHLPGLRYLLSTTWHRLHGFVVRAGKAIIAAVVVLNLLASVGTDGRIGQVKADESLLAGAGRLVTPVFAPMGIEHDNWPATVGMFSGVFAKEVVVGTLDTLYRARQGDQDLAEPPTLATIRARVAGAVESVPANLAGLQDVLTDPLGLAAVGDAESAVHAAGVSDAAFGQLKLAFAGTAGALAYMVFVLLYTPCLATLGAIAREQGRFWAGFAAVWTFVTAYAVAVGVYQVSRLAASPLEAVGWLVAMAALLGTGYAVLLHKARPRVRRMVRIPAVCLDEEEDCTAAKCCH